MVFFEYWDKIEREKFLCCTKWYIYIAMRIVFWFNGGDPAVSDIKRVKRKDIIAK
jgi:hypothetical protein